MLKKLLSFLQQNGISFSSASKTFVIQDRKLTVNDNGIKHTFDLAAGIDSHRAELARIGLTPADLAAIVHLSQRAGIRSTTIESPVGSEIQTPDSDASTKTSSITVTVNGQQRTYDTTSGIPEELKEQLAKEMGISIPEFVTLFKLHSEPALPAPSNDFRPPSGERQTLACPHCGHQVLMTKRCIYCGKELAGTINSAPTDSQSETT